MIVYLVYNRINGKCYVGQTIKTLEQRWYLHVKSAKCGSHLPIHCAIRKYGPEAFFVGWLSHARDREELNALERHFIARYNSITPNGYNRTEGGSGFNGQHTEESRRKMSLAHKGEFQSEARRLKHSKSLKELWARGGFKRKPKGKSTLETRRRISEAIKQHWKKRKQK